jgi:hypothetical protein
MPTNFRAHDESADHHGAQLSIPAGDLIEADKLEATAQSCNDWEKAMGLMMVVDFLRREGSFIDTPHSGKNRFFIKGYGAIGPDSDDGGGLKRMSVTLTYHEGIGPLVELGPYDLGKREMWVLQRAVDDWLGMESGAPDEHDSLREPGALDLDDLLDAARGVIRDAGHDCGVNLADLLDELDLKFAGRFGSCPELIAFVQLLWALRDDEHVFTLNGDGMEFMWIEKSNMPAAVVDDGELIRHGLDRKASGTE